MKLAEAKVFLFIRDIETKIYNVTDSPDFPKVPKELIIESIKYPEKIVAERIIRGRERIFNRYVFQTGIRPISTNTYYGDYYEFKNGKKVNSFILFQFESGGNILTVHFFNSFKLFSRSRAKFVVNYLQSLKNKGSDYPPPLCPKTITGLTANRSDKDNV